MLATFLRNRNWKAISKRVETCLILSMDMFLLSRDQGDILLHNSAARVIRTNNASLFLYFFQRNINWDI